MPTALAMPAEAERPAPKPPHSAAPPHRRPLHLADGDGAVEGYDRSWGDRQQLVIEGDDLRPVSLPDRRRVGVHSVDSGLQQVLTGRTMATVPEDDRLGLLDQRPIPACT